MTKITNLVFEGGSVKGVAYIGALQTLEEHMDMTQIKRVGGASAGAMTAALLALGCDVSRVKALLVEFDFKAVLDDGADSYINTQAKVLNSVEKQERGTPLFFSKMPVKPVKIPMIARMVQQHGIFDGEYLRTWIEEFIQHQVSTLTQGKYDGKNLTFLELHQLTQEYPNVFRDLITVGTNITLGKKEVFSYDNPLTQHAIISDAIRISMSIPALFKPHYLYCKIKGVRCVDLKRHEWVDGGLYDNYPIDCFDKQHYLETGMLSIAEDGLFYNPETLGFRLVSHDKKEFYEGHGQVLENDSGILAFCNAQLNARSALQEEKYSRAEHVGRTIYIAHLNISTLAFNLSGEQQQNLIHSGKEATERYFQHRSCNDVCLPSVHFI